jgi:iron complex outermembrane receptor protein
MRFKAGVYASISTLYKDGYPYALEKTGNAPKTFAIRSVDAYTLLNLKAGSRRDFGESWNVDLSFGVNNATGVKYPLMVFVNQLPDAFIPAPPKAVIFGGINIRYTLSKKGTTNR